jgi:hypothetical protein
MLVVWPCGSVLNSRPIHSITAISAGFTSIFTTRQPNQKCNQQVAVSVAVKLICNREVAVNEQSDREAH